MKKGHTTFRGKNIEDYTAEDLDELTHKQLLIFHSMLSLYLLDDIDEMVKTSRLTQAKKVLSKFTTTC